MEYIKGQIGQELNWTQPHALRRYHELRSDRGLYATLKWKRMFGSLAVAECSEGRYSFKRAGFLRPYVTVREENSESDLAIMKFRSGSVFMNTAFGLSGVLEFETGSRFTFNRLSFWKSRWAFADVNGVPVVTFERKMRGKPTGKVTIDCDSRREPYLHILLTVGWYVIILDYEEEEAAIGTGLVSSPSLG
jgi:hypothetical protein